MNLPTACADLAGKIVGNFAKAFELRPALKWFSSNIETVFDSLDQWNRQVFSIAWWPKDVPSGKLGIENPHLYVISQGFTKKYCDHPFPAYQRVPSDQVPSWRLVCLEKLEAPDDPDIKAATKKEHSWGAPWTIGYQLCHSKAVVHEDIQSRQS